MDTEAIARMVAMVLVQRDDIAETKVMPGDNDEYLIGVTTQGGQTFELTVNPTREVVNS